LPNRRIPYLYCEKLLRNFRYLRFKEARTRETKVFLKKILRFPLMRCGHIWKRMTTLLKVFALKFFVESFH
jgi:hypothetical protein